VLKKSWIVLALIMVLAMGTLLAGCGAPHGDPELTENTHIELVDWHITGLMVINCPVAWVKVTNENDVPIKDVTFQYTTYDTEGGVMDTSTYTLEGTVQPHTSKQFIEQYLGIVNLHSEQLSVKLLSAERAD